MSEPNKQPEAPNDLRVSVVIRTLNESRYLGELLQAIESQVLEESVGGNWSLHRGTWFRRHDVEQREDRPQPPASLGCQ